MPGPRARPEATLQAGGCGGGGGAGAAEPPSAHGRPRCGRRSAAGAEAAARGARGGEEGGGGGGGLQQRPGVTSTLGSPALAARSHSPGESPPSLRSARPPSPRMGWLQMGARGTRTMSLFWGGRGAPLAPESACFGCAKCALLRSLWPAGAQLRRTPRLGTMGGWECLREFGNLYWQSGAGVVVLENGGGAGQARCLSAAVRPCAKQGGWWGNDNV